MPAIPWVIVPTFNEVENIEAIVAAIRSVLLETAPEGFHIVVVDDSPDGTGRLADRLAAATRRSRSSTASGARAWARRTWRLRPRAGRRQVRHRDGRRLLARPQGPAAAAGHGARRRRGPRLGSATCRGRRGGVGPLRRIVSRGGSWYARLVLGVGIRDLTGGFKCFRREVLEGIDLPTVRTKGYGFQVELTYRALMAAIASSSCRSCSATGASASKMSPRIAGEAIWLDA